MNLKPRKALIFSDAHLRMDKVLLNEEGKLYLPLLQNLLTIIKKIEPEYLFNLGDTFHTKDTVSATLLEIYREFLEEVLSYGIKVVQIVGNHDFSVYSEKQIYHALKQYQFEGLTIVDDIYRLDENNGFISYCRTREAFDERLQRLGPVKRLFAHLDINGFNLGDDYVEHKAGLNPEDLEVFSQVWSGHYHEPQTKIVGNTQISYIGSVATTTFGESDQEKRLVLLDLDSGEYESIPTNMTYHRTLRINATDDYPVIPEKALLEGVKFRVIVTGTKEELEIFNLKKPKNYKASVVPDILAEEKPRIELHTEDTQKDVLKKYMEEEILRSYGSLDEAGFDLELLEKMGNSYINQAKNG